MISKHAMNTTTAAIYRGDLDQFLASHNVFFYVIEAQDLRIVTGTTSNIKKRLSDAYNKSLGNVNISLYPLIGDEFETAYKAFQGGSKWVASLGQVQLKVENAIQSYLQDSFESCEMGSGEVFVGCYYDEVTSTVEASVDKMSFRMIWKSLSPRQKIALRNQSSRVGLNAIQQNDLQVLQVTFAECYPDLLTFAKFN